MFRIYIIIFLIFIEGISCKLIAQDTLRNSEQDNKGTRSDPTESKSTDNSTTRAIIIGISKYESYRPELNFADDDAKAFYGYLTSKAGGSVDPSNIRLLLNSEATTGRIGPTLVEAINKSKAGDNLIFFFSGHGDEESILTPDGFLVCYNTSSDVLNGGSIEMNKLKNFVYKTAILNDVKVTIIIDACKSGKISLKEHFSDSPNDILKENQNVLKFYSCRPEGLSYENSIWAHKNIPEINGGGVFTFNLIIGLMGMATDHPEDGKITIREISNFLTKNVPDQTRTRDPEQDPVIYGNPNTIVSHIDQDAMKQIKVNCDLKTISNLCGKVTAKGKGALNYEPLISDSSLIKKYNLFKNYISQSRLIDPPGLNAFDVYYELVQNGDTDEVTEKMNFDLRAALSDNAQFILNMYLKGRDIPEFVSLNSANDNLKTILKMIDERDLYYNDVKSKQLFFEGLLLVKDSTNTNIDSVNKAIDILNASLNYVNNNPFVLCELGNLYYTLENIQKAEENYSLASLYANKWVNPLYNLGNIYRTNKKDYKKAIKYYTKVIKLKTGHLDSYYNRGLSYFNIKKYRKAINDWENVIKLDPSYEIELRPMIYKAYRNLKLQSG